MVNVTTTCECGEEPVCMCNVGQESKCDSCIECGCNPDVCKCECHGEELSHNRVWQTGQNRIGVLSQVSHLHRDQRLQVKGIYLLKLLSHLTSSEYAATTKAKREGRKQHVKQPKGIAKKTARFRRA